MNHKTNHIAIPEDYVLDEEFQFCENCCIAAIEDGEACLISWDRPMVGFGCEACNGSAVTYAVEVYAPEDRDDFVAPTIEESWDEFYVDF